MSTTPVNETAAAVGTLATPAAYTGAATAAGFGFLASNWIGLAGLVLGVLTFLVNWWYKHQSLLLQKAELKAKIESERSLASQTATNDNCNNPRKEIP